MPTVEDPDSPLDPALQDALVEAGSFRSQREAFEHGLVILALGIPYWLHTYEQGFRLYVQSGWEEEARRQLELYAGESKRWPPVSGDGIAEPTRTAVVLPLLWALVTIAIFRAQELWPGKWESFGTLDAAQVFGRHQFWRIATSLFLHADIAHLTANLVSGFFVFSAALTNLGRIRGLALLVLSSLAGNATVAWLASSSDYRSLGASTAVFAGLGVLTGAAFRRAISRPRHWRSLFVPVAAGVTLLGLFGAGGLHTDVAAHACGFAAGLLAGALGGSAESASPGRASI